MSKGEVHFNNLVDQNEIFSIPKIFCNSQFSPSLLFGTLSCTPSPLFFCIAFTAAASPCQQLLHLLSPLPSCHSHPGDLLPGPSPRSYTSTMTSQPPKSFRSKFFHQCVFTVFQLYLFDQKIAFWQGAMQAGVDLVANLVGVTLGPKGRNVVLSNKYGPPKIVNDGETILKEVT